MSKKDTEIHNKTSNKTSNKTLNKTQNKTRDTELNIMIQILGMKKGVEYNNKNKQQTLRYRHILEITDDFDESEEEEYRPRPIKNVKHVRFQLDAYQNSEENNKRESGEENNKRESGEENNKRERDDNEEYIENEDEPINTRARKRIKYSIEF